MDQHEPPPHKEGHRSKGTSPHSTTLHILTATYGPSEGRRLLDGTLVDFSNRASFVPYTRDVRPFLAALVKSEQDHESEISKSEGPCFNVENKNNIALMDGRSMNTVFGDPCPGTTKILRVEYRLRDEFWIMDTDSVTTDSELIGVKDSSNGKKRLLRMTSRVYQSTFAEHDRVLLKRQDALFTLPDATQEEEDGMKDVTTTDNGQSECSFARQKEENYSVRLSNSTPNSSLSHVKSQSSASCGISLSRTNPTSNLFISTSPWRLARNISEITLPLILPYLAVRERAMCQLVCSSWREIVLERGIAVVVDVNDTGLFPKHNTFPHESSTNFGALSPFIPPSPSVESESHPSLQDSEQRDSSRALLRGLLTHSHSSLESLVLNDYLPLRPLLDLHPTLPYLRKLKRLDISRIPSITDDTLQLISTFIGTRLEVLYMKGLSQISNAGVVHLVRSCTNLRVLDVSYLHQLEDEVGIAIGNHLTKLEILHGRDNYRWTNASVDLITTNCKNLVQATFWGCIRLTHVHFSETDDKTSSSVNRNSNSLSDEMPLISSISYTNHSKIILLNLWGCHGLTNSSASLMSSLPHLRSLCVSECHKLSDAFVVGVAQSLPQLIHLQLRYLRRITDLSIDAIASRLIGLYSLDVSFCTKLTVGGLTKLLCERCDSLSELRIFSCRQLNLEGGSITSNGGSARIGIGGGRRLARALASVRQNGILSVLDARACDDQASMARDETFLQVMSDLGFEEELRGFFRRPALSSEAVRRQLNATFSCDIRSLGEV
ncbi:hypothetical protein HJC23_008773 [Cyclotella cryptica]|uniref:F-box/LRR-repeat protein 15-like leucin rich repeat domain-containing protein n=1 Tax=Cyclotella cryptica TaxID=29204 RepID=A0ABD3PCL3_9STRA|eukprot:CCRYP_015692-RA/>CCRYP_015692-RA protein AED:0.21 eAED:0.21 QI:0/-1/0/1/-1/1/1/0/776